eukprot:TRINITY_DN13307_c0_g1_i1.p1 TRINITY_DN13307_c0_g1~~TRINITY_DN13307_c0_g1_i1.p1  ORF type:complete len:240 (-),score=64.34 TRINITY_DN13307_c0_g1_i1:35-754(-)
MAGYGVQESLASYGVAAAGPSAGGANQGYVRELPKHVREDLEIQQLVDLYQSQLAELNACHSLLTVDQERLASMLAPYVNAAGELVMEAPDPDVLLFKEGLELRLKEFEQDGRRIQLTEQKLQEKIDSASNDYEQAVRGIALTTDTRIFKRLREQQRQIELQQQEIDQVRFEKEMLREETKRLRELAATGERVGGRRQDFDERRDLRPLPMLHQQLEATYRAPPVEGTRERVRFPQSRG